MKNKGVISVLGAGALWGTAGMFVRWFSSNGFSSMQTVAVRLLVTAIMFVATALIFNRKAFIIKLKDIWCFLGTGLCSVLIFTLCYYKTMEQTSLSVAAILLYTAPIFVMFLSCILFKEKLTGRKLIACALAFGGCFLISEVWGSNGITAKGLFFGVMSGLCYALYSIFSRCAINRGYSSLTVSLYTFVIASAGSLFVTDLKGGLMLLSENKFSIVMAILFSLINAFLPYLLYTLGLRTVESGKASIFASVEPIVATLISLFVFSEPISLWGVMGIALILISVVLLNLGAKKE